MKVSELIEKLRTIATREGDVGIVVGYDKDGWYDVEDIEPVYTEKEVYINIKTSNEM